MTLMSAGTQDTYAVAVAEEEDIEILSPHAGEPLCPAYNI